MGCPDKYYKRALKCFAYMMAYEEDTELAKELSNEESEEKLEEFILDKKNHCDEKRFYYNAGMVSRFVLDEAENDGIDGFNACIGGLNMFDNFIGLEDDTDQSRVKE